MIGIIGAMDQELEVILKEAVDNVTKVLKELIKVIW